MKSTACLLVCLACCSRTSRPEGGPRPAASTEAAEAVAEALGQLYQAARCPTPAQGLGAWRFEARREIVIRGAGTSWVVVERKGEQLWVSVMTSAVDFTPSAHR